MFRIENIYYLYALALIPVMIGIFIFNRYRKKKALLRFGNSELVKTLFIDFSSQKPVIKFIFLMIALLMLIVAIANPQIGSKLEEVKRKGADLMICLDVSNSMKAQDLQPNRLEKAKQAIERLIDKLEGDRIGVIVFAGEAYVQLPITTDYSAAKLFLDNIDTDIIPTQGTSISSAINLAIESFGKDVGKNKSIIIITDGEDNEEGAVAAAKDALSKGINIHTIGIGSPEGAPIPVYQNGKQVGYKKDKQGNTVITKLNDVMLQEIAQIGNGTYVRATNSETGLNIILSKVQKLEKKEFESKMYSDYDDKFYYFIWIALFFITLEVFITERKSKLWEKLNLFGQKNV